METAWTTLHLFPSFYQGIYFFQLKFLAMIKTTLNLLKYYKLQKFYYVATLQTWQGRVHDV